MKLYHASSIQGMKTIEPKMPQDGVSIKMGKEVYASKDKSYAAGFCFNWKSDEGFRFNQVDEHGGPWELKVPPKYSQRLNIPCSLYEVEINTFRNLQMSTPEYASKVKVKVLEEDKYESALICLRENGVKISILKRKPFMDNSLIKKFREIIQKKYQ